MALLLWTVIGFVVCDLLRRQISFQVQAMAILLTGNRGSQMWFEWLIFLPGILLHEFSHWLMAKLLLVRVLRVSVWPKQRENGQWEMGSVWSECPDLLRRSLIGLAPLLLGSVAVLFIGVSQLALMDKMGLVIDGNDLGQAMGDILTRPINWLWFYLTFAISNCMLPSEPDRAPWLRTSFYVGLGLMLLFFWGYNPTNIPQILLDLGEMGLTILILAFAVTVVFDVLFIVTMVILQKILETITGKVVVRR